MKNLILSLVGTLVLKVSKVALCGELGANTTVERWLTALGLIVPREDGTFEVYSQEIRDGVSGQIAQEGDYFKVDNAGFPYPVVREKFLAKHSKVGENAYKQITYPCEARTANDLDDPAVQYLVANKGLTINRDNDSKFFGAPLWGTWEVAAKDAIILLYEVKRDDNGNITDVDFNFVKRTEFDENYQILG